MFRLCFAAFLPLLTGCAAFDLGAPRGTLADDELHGALADLLCRVEPNCRRIRLYVLDREFPQAEMFPDGRLLINIGMLTATRSQSEIAFVLAHEMAHRRLKHLPAKDAEARAKLEMQADDFAIDRLRASALQPAAGYHLLVRLLELSRQETEREWQMEAAASGVDKEAEKTAAIRQRAVVEGLKQLELRIQSIKASMDVDSESPAAAGDPFWRERLLPYRSARQPEPQPERAVD